MHVERRKQVISSMQVLWIFGQTEPTDLGIQVTHRLCKVSLKLTYHEARLNLTSVWDCSIVRSDSASIR
jgi:hypothetical protein